MACPFFIPDERWNADWTFPHRLPLGAGWKGTCTAPGHQNVRPGDDELKSWCNLGYARCSRIPTNRHADAICFALGQQRDGVLRVRFACERDHLPAEHGESLDELATGLWREQHVDARLQRMAEGYVRAQMGRPASRLDQGLPIPAG